MATLSETTDNITAITEQVTGIHDKDLRGGTSPFRWNVQRGQDPAQISVTNIFNLTDYKWYTSDYRRIFERDYYNKIYEQIEYFPIPKQYDNTFLGQGEKAIDELYENGKNYVNGVITEAKSTIDNVKSIFGKGKKEKDISQQITINFNAYLNSFQKIKVSEFKPDDMLTLRLNLLTAFFKTITSDQSNTAADPITKKFENYMAAVFKGIKSTLKDMHIDFDNIKSMEPKDRIGFAIEMYKNIISGFYTASYEFPLLDGAGRNLFLNSEGSEGWSEQSFMGRFAGEGDSSIAAKVAGFIGSTAEMLGVQGFDIASRPKWSIKGGGRPYNGNAGVEVKFILYNNDLHSFKANTKMVNCFVGGNLWLQDTFIQKSSSLYTVEIPGRAYLSLCKADIKVNFIGKIRKISEKNIKKLVQNSQDNDTGTPAEVTELGSTQYNEQLLLNIPDAYEVNIIFTSLLPNNFNTYMMNVNKLATIGVGTNISSYYEKFAANIKTELDLLKAEQENSQDLAESTAIAAETVSNFTQQTSITNLNNIKFVSSSTRIGPLIN